MKKEEKYVGRSKAQDGLPHDVVVAVALGVATTATKEGVKAAVKGIKDRIAEKKPKIIRP